MKPQGKVTIFMIVMIVMLSIYYFMLPDNDTKVGQKTTTKTSQTINKSEEFEQLRAELNEHRQTMISSLQGVLSSPNVSVEEKNTAIEAIQKIQTLTQNESLLELQIINLGYDDCFVKATETDVNVSVYVDNLTLEEVNEIILMAKNQFGMTINVVVHYSITDVN